MKENILSLTEREFRAVRLLVERKISDGSQEHEINKFEFDGEIRSVREKLAKIERELA